MTLEITRMLMNQLFL